MRLRAIYVAAGFYLTGIFGDWASSHASNHLEHVYEENPFYRDETYKWVFHKALVGDALQTLVIAGLCFGLWKLGELLREHWGEALACTPLLYYGFDRLITAVVPNFLFALNFYVTRQAGG